MKRILIVEDDEAIVGLIERGLLRWGFDAARVRNFQNVMEEFAEFEAGKRRHDLRKQRRLENY